MANRRSDNTFRGARNLQVNRTIRDSLGQNDRVDFYKFRASGQVNFNLALSGLRANASVRLLNARRAPIAVSNQSGNRAEQISATLAGGTYYVQVQFRGRRGTTRYNLRASSTPVPPVIEDGTFATASDLGVLTTTAVRQNTVGGNDPADFYRFTLPDVANLQIRVTGANTGVRFALVQDSNANGLVDSNEILASDSSFAANSLANATQDFPSGAYFIRVESTSTQATAYQLEVVPTLFGGNVAPDPGNTLSTASDLGVFSGTRSIKEYVGVVDATDIYRFTVNDLTKLQITRVGSFRDPEVQLIRDSNNNGLIDVGEIFLTDNRFGVFSDSDTIDVPVGTYFVRVDSQANTSYELTLVGTPYGGNGLPDPGNTLFTARELGVLAGTSSLKEYVGNVLDPDDFYRFTVNTPVTLQARITTSSDISLDFNLIRDTNNNGLIDSNEILRSGTASGSDRTGRLTNDLQAGTYFVRVEPRFSGNFSTNYELSLITT